MQIHCVNGRILFGRWGEVCQVVFVLFLKNSRNFFFFFFNAIWFAAITCCIAMKNASNGCVLGCCPIRLLILWYSVKSESCVHHWWEILHWVGVGTNWVIMLWRRLSCWGQHVNCSYGSGQLSIVQVNCDGVGAMGQCMWYKSAGQLT